MNNPFAGAMQSLVKTKTSEASGVSSVVKNIEAILHVSEMIKTSYGPQGTHKLIVNAHNKLVLSRSCSSILAECDIEHPAVKLLVAPLSHLALLGDCTGFMLFLVGEILQSSLALLNQDVCPTDVASGLRECQEELEGALAQCQETVDFAVTDTPALEQALSGVLKEGKLAELLARSISRVSENGLFNMDSIRVTKINVGSLEDSERFQGMLLERCPEGAQRAVRNGRVAIYNCPLAPSNLETKGTVLFKTAEDLLGFSKEDEATVKDCVNSITSSGANVVVCNGSVDLLMLDYLNSQGVAVLKITSKFDLRRLWRLVGGRISNSIRRLGEEELGTCDELRVEEYGGKKYTRISGPGKLDTILLRNSLPERLNEYERLLMKGVSAMRVCAKEASENGGKVRLLKGGGACERQVSGLLREAAEKYEDLRKICIQNVAESITNVSKGVEGLKADRVYDVGEIKRRALEYAISSAADILSIAQMFITRDDGQMQAPSKRPGHWDEQD